MSDSETAGSAIPNQIDVKIKNEENSTKNCENDENKTIKNKESPTESTHSSVSEDHKTKEKSKNKTKSNSIPKNKVLLKLIIASGKAHEFMFPILISVGEVTQYVYDNWPEAWAEEKETITSHHVLRLIYQGRFLHENVSFLALNLPAGKKTVMHLVPREKLPQFSADDMEKSPKNSSSSCCCNIF